MSHEAIEHEEIELKTEVKPDAEPPAEEKKEEKDISFASYQILVFVTCYYGYCLYLYNRKAFSFTLPHVIMEEYFTSFEIGLILTTQTVTYTLTKFVAGCMTDFYSPKIMFSIGLFGTGFVMVGFTDNVDVVNLTLLSIFNGIAQGVGWPSAVKIIRSWYPPTQFGFWWAMLCTSSNMVGSVGPAIANSLSVNFGWRMAVQLPAILAIVSSFFIYFTNIDKPSDVGYEDQLTLGGAEEGHWSDLAASDFMMVLATSYSLVFMIKTTCQDWGETYMVHERGLSQYAASSYITSMEIGGIFGCLLAGSITDYLIKKGHYFGTQKSPRMVAAQIFIAAVSLCLNLFLFTVDSDSPAVWINVLGFALGFFLYGAINLFGTTTLETAPIHMTGCAHSILGFAAAIGTIGAAMPVSYIGETYGWLMVFILVDALCLVQFFLMVATKGIKATFLQTSYSGPAKLSTKCLSSIRMLQIALSAGVIFFRKRNKGRIKVFRHFRKMSSN